MEQVLRHLNIKALAEDDRPREKLLALGRHNLSDAELLAIILVSGTRTETAVQLAQRMLSAHGNDMNRLARLDLTELKKFKGVGTVKAISILAAFELCRRRKGAEAGEKPKISSSLVAYQVLQQQLADLPHEEFRILILNRANQVVAERQISRGGISGTVVDIRLICKCAVECNASGVIMAHNHPSGQVEPSEQDKQITRQMRDALKLFEISLLDHLIIGDQAYFSFADRGMI